MKDFPRNIAVRIRFFFRHFVIALILSLLLTPSIYGQDRLSPSYVQQALIILTNPQDYNATVVSLQAKQVAVRHQFPPDAMIVALPESMHRQEVQALADTDSYRVFYDVVDLEQAAGWPKTTYQAAYVWNSLKAEAQTDHTSDDLYQQSVHEEASYSGSVDAFEAPPSELALPVGENPTPNYMETSQFLLGRVAVGIVLPESDGSADPSQEDWTSQETDRVVSEIVNAMEWWADLQPQAHLSFVYDNLAGGTVPTAVEPISRPRMDQGLWINDAMTAMGFDGSNYFDQVRQYNHYMRETYQTDWALTIFVVDSSNDGDNTFSDHYFAYAYLGGPFMVMTYGNQNYGISNMDAVTAHELGHVFQALDQYASSRVGCSLQAGYLSVENQNGEAGCVSNEASIMRGRISPYISHSIDYYAKGQVGWWDSDADNILDPADVGLASHDTTWSQKDLPNVLTINSTIEEIPFDSNRNRDLLINRLQAANYRVGDGPWLPVSAVDGQFDAYLEEITFVTDPLPTGTHAVLIQTIDNFGKVNEQLLTTVTTIDPVEHSLNTEIDLSRAKSPILEQGETTQVLGIATQNSGQAIAKVEYRIDGQPWQPGIAADGAFDSDAEKFTITIETTHLSVGEHLIQVRATDNLGQIEGSPATQIFQVEAKTYFIFLPAIEK